MWAGVLLDLQFILPLVLHFSQPQAVVQNGAQPVGFSNSSQQQLILQEAGEIEEEQLQECFAGGGHLLITYEDMEAVS